MVFRTIAIACLVAASIAPPVSAAPAQHGRLRVVALRKAPNGDTPQVQPRGWAGPIAMYDDEVIPDAARIVLVPGSSIVLAALESAASATIQGAGSPLEFHVGAVPGDRAASLSAANDGATLTFASRDGSFDIAYTAEFVVAGRPERIERMEGGEGAQRTTFGVVVSAPAVVSVVDGLAAGATKPYPLRRGLLRADFRSADAARDRYRDDVARARAARSAARGSSAWYDRRLALALNNEGVALGEVNVREALARLGESIRTFPAQSAGKAIAYYNRGLVYAKANRLHEALADYTRAIGLDRLDSSAYNNRGAVYSMLEQSPNATRGRYQAAAIRDYTTAAALDRSDATARTNLGFEYLRRDRPEKALAYLRAATAIAPDDAYALDDLAVADIALRHDADARRDLLRASERGGGPAASYNLGLEDERAHDLEGALKSYRDAVSRDPRFSDAYDRMGAVYHAMGGHEDDAVRAFDRAIAEDARRARYYNDRAVTLLALDRVPAAIADLKEAQRLGDTDARITLDLAGAYRRQGDLKAALDAYDAALQGNPHDFDALAGRADVYRIEGDDAHAIADDTAALAEHAGDTGALAEAADADVYDARGRAYRHSADIAHAIADFQQAVALGEKARAPAVDLARAHADLAAAYLVRAAPGDTDHALGEAQEAVRLDPDNGQLHADLAAIELQKRGGAAAARDEFAKAAAILPARPYIALMRDIADRESHSPTHLAQAVRQLDMHAWPAPILEMYLGKMTWKDTVRAAQDSPPADRDRHVCEATFYAADFERLDRHEDEARKLYTDATAKCAAGSSERAAAIYALKAPPGWAAPRVRATA